MATVNISPAVEQILASFDKLPAADQLRAAKEIQNRITASSDAPAELDLSPPSDEEMVYMASKLFEMYDEEERQNGCP